MNQIEIEFLGNYQLLNYLLVDIAFLPKHKRTRNVIFFFLNISLYLLVHVHVVKQFGEHGD